MANERMKQAYDSTVKPGTADWGSADKQAVEAEESEPEIDYTAVTSQFTPAATETGPLDGIGDKVADYKEEKAAEEKAREEAEEKAKEEELSSS